MSNRHVSAFLLSGPLKPMNLFFFGSTRRNEEAFLETLFKTYRKYSSSSVEWLICYFGTIYSSSIIKKLCVLVFDMNYVDFSGGSSVVNILNYLANLYSKTIQTFLQSVFQVVDLNGLQSTNSLRTKTICFNVSFCLGLKTK
jgi:hypothetical protein